jgi:AcrR family transcriptional regulator
MPLNKSRVINAALTIVDREGLDALNMRRLGTELGVDPMAIYRHVDGRDGVLDGLAQRMWEEVNVAIEDGPWREQLREFTRALRRVFHAHPYAAPLMLQRFVIPVSLLESVHAQLRALRDAGFSEERAGAIIRTLQSFGVGYGLAELTCFGIPEVGGADLSQAEMLVLLGQALPPGVPPHLADAAIALYAVTNPEAAFESGLDLLLDGLRPDHGPPGSSAPAAQS